MTDANRDLRREFIKRFRRLMDEKNVTQLVLACAIGMNDAHLGFCLNADKDHRFPTELLGKCVPLLGVAVFRCIPGAEDFVITEKPTPVCNVEQLDAVGVAVVDDAVEMFQEIRTAKADGRIDRAEQARIDARAADLHCSTATAAETTRAAVPTRGI